MSKESKQNLENPLYNILFNIILPVVILNNLTHKWGDKGPLYALLLALSLPVIYGLIDYFKRNKTNIISIIGIINITTTGGLALLKLEGFWFALKEGLFPLIVGLALLFSAYTTKPFIKTISNNLLDMSLINTEDPKSQEQFRTLFKNSTLIFALSFFISSLLNFVLAIWIFQEIDPSLSESEQATILNSQIARMTWMGYLVIALPLTGMMALNIWYLIKGVTRITQLPIQKLMKNMDKQ